VRRNDCKGSRAFCGGASRCRPRRRGVCTRRERRLGRCYGHQTVVYYAAAAGDLPMQTRPRSPELSRLHRFRRARRARFLRTPSRAVECVPPPPPAHTRIAALFLFRLAIFYPYFYISSPFGALSAELVSKGSPQTRRLRPRPAKP